MEKIIAEQIEKNFSEYKEEMIWILIGFSLLVLIIQFSYNLCLSRKIEKFKGEIKRSEIKYSRHSEMQIESLKNLYNHLVDLHFVYSNILKPKYLTHDIFKKNINLLFSTFNLNMDYFHRNKILFTDEIINQITVLHSKYKINQVTLKNQLDELSTLEENYESIDPQALYGNPDTESDSIRLRIITIQADQNISTFEKDIKDMRNLVEKYFKSLTK